MIIIPRKHYKRGCVSELAAAGLMAGILLRKLRRR